MRRGSHRPSVRAAWLLAALLALLPAALWAAAGAGDGGVMAWVLGNGPSTGGGYRLAPLPGPMAVSAGDGYTLGGRVGEMLPQPGAPEPSPDPVRIFLPLVDD